jgi:hypothetical protein
MFQRTPRHFLELNDSSVRNMKKAMKRRKNAMSFVSMTPRAK